MNEDEKIFWIRFGESEYPHLKVKDFTNILASFNSLILRSAYHLELIDGTANKKEDFELVLFPKIRNESVDVGVSVPPIPNSSQSDNPKEKVYEHVIEVLKNISSSEKDWFDNKFNSDDKVVLYTVLKDLYPVKGKFSITYNSFNEEFKDSVTLIECSSEKRKVIDQWIKSEIKAREGSVIGEYCGFKMGGNTGEKVTIWIKADGKEITCDLAADSFAFNKLQPHQIIEVFGVIEQSPGKNKKVKVKETHGIDFPYEDGIKDEAFLTFKKRWAENGYGEENWDSYGADPVPFPEELIKFASEYYAKLHFALKKGFNKVIPLPFIGPYDDENQIVMEWNGKDWNISIIIEDSTKLIIVLVFPNFNREYQHQRDHIESDVINKMGAIF